MKVFLVLLLFVIERGSCLDKDKHCLCKESRKSEPAESNRVSGKVFESNAKFDANFKSNAESDEVSEFDYPWVVSIRFRSDTELCIGTIVNEQTILTTSRCVERLNKEREEIDSSAVRSYDDFVIGYGSRDLSNYGPDQLLSVAEVIRMPGRYHAEQLSRDLAMIKTKERMDFSDSSLVQPACFLRTTDDQKIFHYGKVSVLGFGVNATVKANDTGLSKSLDYNATSKLKASFYLDTSGNKESYCNLYNFLICLTSVERDQKSCISDIGSPLHYLMRDEPRKFVVGVASFVAETDPNRTVLYSCDQNNKAYYMRLTFFMDWITENAGDDALCVFKRKIVRDYQIHPNASLH